MLSSHAYHLYVIRLDGINRETVFCGLRANGIGVNVHYIPVHLQLFYKQKFGTSPDLCPVAEKAYEEIISLPMFPGMNDEMLDFVIGALEKVNNGKKK